MIEGFSFLVGKMFKIKELLIYGMQLGVGITAFVGVTSALSTLPVIGDTIGIYYQ